ncbi:MAG: carboxypeptidase-like regulatory domain-containing protein [Candidatus Acidiferrum sp.]
MRNFRRILLALAAFIYSPAFLAAQTSTGALDLTAQVAPTGAQDEPVRQFNLYILTRSYADVIQEVSGQNILPTREEFIDKLTVSPELKAWLKAHKTLDLTTTDLDKSLTTDDIMKIPEFFAAYERSNSGGVTKGFPLPKYRESDKTANPEKYAKQKEEFLSDTKKFIETHPASVQGIELELTSVNPKVAWDNLHVRHAASLAQAAPDAAQVKYLAAKVQTDLDGHAFISGLPPGNYWVSSLGVEAISGDRRLKWDVPITIQASKTLRLSLSNLNASNNLKPADTP